MVELNFAQSHCDDQIGIIKYVGILFFIELANNKYPIVFKDSIKRNLAPTCYGYGTCWFKRDI